MPRMTMIESIRSGLDVVMERDERVVVFGQDVGYFGGVFRCTAGLKQKHGKSRCFDTPISELGIVGSAVGMAAYGLRPCVEIQFADYFYPAYDQIVSEAARLRYRSAGQFTCPLVIRMPTGGGIFGAQTHSQSPESLFTHVSGLKVVVPSNPIDAKGLLIAAIEDPDPVIFLEPKRLYNGPFDGHHDRPVTPWSKHAFGEVDAGYYTVPLGKATIRRQGTAVTVLTYGTMVHVAEAAVQETGIDAEIIDLRTLLPLDLDTIVESVRKTRRHDLGSRRLCRHARSHPVRGGDEQGADLQDGTDPPTAISSRFSRRSLMARSTRPSSSPTKPRSKKVPTSTSRSATRRTAASRW